MLFTQDALALLAENGLRFFADGQKLIETGTRYLSKVSPIHAAQSSQQAWHANRIIVH